MRDIDTVAADQSPLEGPGTEPKPPPTRSVRPSPSLAERLLLAGLVCALGIAVFANSWGAFVPDTKPELYFTPGRMLVDSLHAWLPSVGQVGLPNFDTGMVPVAAIVWVIRALGATPWVAVRIWRILLYVAAGAGIRRWFHEVADGRSTPASRLAVTVFYVANPLVISNGDTTPVMLPYAILPWMLAAHLRSIRAPRSWRGAALFAVAFAAMSGMNAGIIPFFLLVAVPCQLVFARLALGVPLRALWSSLWRCASLSAAISAYWIVPSVYAVGTGESVISASENPASVSLTTSWAEVARLLGNWPLYGRLANRPFDPNHLDYITRPLVVVASCLVPVVAALGAWWARGRAKLLAAVMLAIAVPVMVGEFPGYGSVPWSVAVRWVFAHVPGSVGFRTTAKIGPLVAIAYTLLIGLGVLALARRARSWPRAVQVALVGGAIALEVVNVLPVFAGRLWNQTFVLPSYWTSAAARVDAGSHDSRVLVVPGGSGANYIWGLTSPDDILSYVLSRPAVSASTVYSTGNQASNFMAGWDTPLNADSLEPGALSTVARYLGANQVLVRSDTDYPLLHGASPSTIVTEVADDGGLRIVGTFGTPGMATDLVYPLALYDVDASSTAGIVQAQAAASGVLIDGDGAAVPELAALGILDGSEPFQYLGGMTAAGLTQATEDGSTIVITDTNRRRVWGQNRLTDVQGPTLPANAPIDQSISPSVTLFQDRPYTETTTTLVGAASVTGTVSPFSSTVPYGQAWQAFDGNPSTAWLTGGFGQTGMKITVDFGRTVALHRITLMPAKGLGVGARPTEVTISAGGRNTHAAIGPGPTTTVTLPRVKAGSLTVEITSVSPGGGAVGFAEIGIPGVRVRQVTDLPTALDRLYGEVASSTRAKLAALPLDVVMTREAPGPGMKEPPAELTLDRVFDVPQARTFGVAGTLDQLSDLPIWYQLELLSPQGQRHPPCFPVGTVDGRPLDMQLGEPLDQAGTHMEVSLVGCNAARPLRLGKGRHELVTDPGVVMDRIVLSSAGRTLAQGTAKGATRDGSRAPSVTIVSSSATRIVVHLGRASAPYYVLGGQAYDPGWKATLDGHVLGTPVHLDGYSFGWRIGDLGPHTLVLNFAPQADTNLAIGISGVAALGMAAVILWPLARRRRRQAETPVTLQRMRRRPMPAAEPGDAETASEQAGAGPAGAGTEDLQTDAGQLPIEAAENVGYGGGPAGASSGSRRWAHLSRWIVGWAVFVAALGCLDGIVGLVVAIACMAALTVAHQRASRLILTGAIALCAVPVTLILHGLPTPLTVSPQFAATNTVAYQFAFAGLALVVTGIAADAMGRKRQAEPLADPEFD